MVVKGVETLDVVHTEIVHILMKVIMITICMHISSTVDYIISCSVLFRNSYITVFISNLQYIYTINIV